MAFAAMAAAAAAAAVFDAAGSREESSEVVAQDLPDFAASTAFQTGCSGYCRLSADCCSRAAE